MSEYTPNGLSPYANLVAKSWNSALPMTALWEITYACNHKCAFCYNCPELGRRELGEHRHLRKLSCGRGGHRCAVRPVPPGGIARSQDRVAAAGVQGDAAAENASGIVSFFKPGADLPALHQKLVENGVVGSLRSDREGQKYIRFSPHFYNSDAELDRALALL